MEEENKNIEDENCYHGNTESVGTMDRNENMSHCEISSSGGEENSYEENGRLLEQMPSTESESSACSKTVTVPIKDSLDGQGVVQSGAAAHGSADRCLDSQARRLGFRPPRKMKLLLACPFPRCAGPELDSLPPRTQ